MTFVPKDSLVPFFPYCPYDHPRNEGPTKIHLFVFAIVLFPDIDSCRDVNSDPIGLSEDTCRPVPDLCCVVAFVEEMIRCFFLILTEVAS
jgi:hypothetical protein